MTRKSRIPPGTPVRVACDCLRSPHWFAAILTDKGLDAIIQAHEGHYRFLIDDCPVPHVTTLVEVVNG